MSFSLIQGGPKNGLFLKSDNFATTDDRKACNIRRPCSDFMDMLRRLISCRIIIIIIIIMSQDVTSSSLLSTSNGVHYFSICFNHLQYLFICFMLGPWYFHHIPPYSYLK